MIIDITVLISSLSLGLFMNQYLHDLETKKRFYFRNLGVPSSCYILGQFLMDYSLFIFYSLNFLITILLWDDSKLDWYPNRRILSFISLITFGFSAIPLAYLIAYLFRNYENGATISSVVLYTIGYFFMYTQGVWTPEIYRSDTWLTIIHINPFIYLAETTYLPERYF